MNLKELLQKRKEIKRRKPTFVMQDAHKLKRLSQHWRRPRGIDSKIRLGLKGYNKAVEPGYGSPQEVKFMHPAGVMPVIVANVNDLANINKDKEGVIISSSVGKKKKIAILTKAKELSLKVLNVKDSDKYIASVTDQLKARKDEKEKKQKKRAEKKAEKKDDKKGKKEEGLADKVVTEEEKSAQEKKEKDKVLTKKEI